MANEQILVAVGGSRFDSWVHLAVAAGFGKACRSFSFLVAAEGGASRINGLFQTGTPIEITASGDLLFTGFVNRRTPRFGPEDASIHISGRAKGQDHVDCTCSHPTGRFENKDPVEIANALGRFEGKVRTDRKLQKLDSWQVTPGETVFAALDHLCADQGMTCCGQPDGDILVTDASKAERHAGALIEGATMPEGEAEFSDENRHAETRVRGQRGHGHGAANLRQGAVAMDSGVRKGRVHILHHRGEATDRQIRLRAADVRNRKAGHGIRFATVLPRWRDDAGALWTPGRRIFTQSPFCDLAQDMLIDDIDFGADSARDGLAAKLALVDPQAYGGQAGKAVQSGGEWGLDGSAAR